MGSDDERGRILAALERHASHQSAAAASSEERHAFIGYETGEACNVRGKGQTKQMQSLTRVATFLSVTLLPAIAIACPGYSQQAHGACCGSAFSGEVTALSVGVLVGVASIAVESVLRRR
mgnify:CR=1 FL=1